MHVQAVLVLWLAAWVRSALAYKSGAPIGACESMVPHHNRSFAIQSTAPYVILPRKDVIKTGQEVIFTLKGQGDSDYFKGFFIQVRIHAHDRAVGSFPTDKSDVASTKSLDCFSLRASALTHRDSSRKNSITAKWMAPRHVAVNGTVVRFYYSIVKDFDTYWTKLEGPSIKVYSAATRLQPSAVPLTWLLLLLLTCTSSIMNRAPSG